LRQVPDGQLPRGQDIAGHHVIARMEGPTHGRRTRPAPGRRTRPPPPAGRTAGGVRRGWGPRTWPCRHVDRPGPHRQETRLRRGYPL